MTTYEMLVEKAFYEGIEVLEFHFTDGLHGLYCDHNIAISDTLDDIAKTCVLAEELGHHYTSHGQIVDPENSETRRQEKRARMWAHEKLIPIDSLISACIACEGLERWELAEYLGVTDSFLCDTLEAYKARYGLYIESGDYCLYFDPLTLAHFNY